ncbi:hypothetical protein FGADI_1628 [Fusarium gaditjirri]|uniref:PA14 domain-containing protein n=1 Tax=Fusarium gaditjirri TaxID=282569 RepID=A0A8H4TKK1_9HYPO|nr:hypothetical protein FGADI_1628 [Fusarium gaditjirri]
MHSKKLLSLALSLFMAESVVASPCKPKTTTAAASVASTALIESTTTILPVTSTTDTTLATVETSTAAETSETETEAATTLLTSTTAALAVDTTTTEEGTTTAGETTTAVGDTTTTAAETTATTETGTTIGEAQTTTTADAETTTTEVTTTTTVEPVCAQTLVLANPTPIFDSKATVDDHYKTVVPPFPIEIFGVGSTDVYVSVNGLVTLNDYSTIYSNTALPSQFLPISIMPYWDDLANFQNTCNSGIYYDVYETDRGNTFSIEWQLDTPGSGETGEHFSASFYQDFPGLVRFEYYKTTKHGSSATVGLQNGQLYAQYSYNQANSVPDEFYVEIDTSSGVGVIESGIL